ncbi:MAG TPA: RidA family protein [Gemmatimonadaceae bacterium]|nr:RidA family protein [Gemmatimonadaceae bacterium]
MSNIAPAVHTSSERGDKVKQVKTAHAPAAIGPYSQAIIANGVLYSAGQIPLDPATGEITGSDIVAQTDRVMENLQSVLEQGGASWGNVVKTTVYLSDLAHFPTVNEIYARWLGDARPARSTVQVAALPRGAMIEVDLIAVLPD